MGSEKIFFKNLDSIRFIAALMVYLGHGISPIYQFFPIKDTFWEKLLYTISNGEKGVSVFFVLSGFLITYLLISEYELKSKISLKNFYVRRILRIWPLYFSVVAFSFFIYPFLKSLIGMHSNLCSNVYYHLVFLSNFDVINIQKHCILNSAMSQNITWSVSVEEQFYAFWPIIFVLFPKRFWIYSIMSVIIGSLIFRIINRGDNWVLGFHTFAVLCDLGMGGLMAYLIKTHIKIRRFFESISTRTHLIFFILSVCLLLFKEYIFSFKYGNVIEHFCTTISFALIISGQALTKSQSKLNLHNFKFGDRWGKYTYGIYLIHPMILLFLFNIIRVLPVSKDSFLSVLAIGVLGFPLTLIVSKWSYTYFELRFLLLKDKFTTIKTHE